MWNPLHCLATQYFAVVVISSLYRERQLTRYRITIPTNISFSKEKAIFKISNLNVISDQILQGFFSHIWQLAHVSPLLFSLRRHKLPVRLLNSHRSYLSSQGFLRLWDRTNAAIKSTAVIHWHFSHKIYLSQLHSYNNCYECCCCGRLPSYM